jgi:hypothetical protein
MQELLRTQILTCPVFLELVIRYSGIEFPYRKQFGCLPQAFRLPGPAENSDSCRGVYYNSVIAICSTVVPLIAEVFNCSWREDFVRDIVRSTYTKRCTPHECSFLATNQSVSSGCDLFSGLIESCGFRVLLDLIFVRPLVTV